MAAEEPLNFDIPTREVPSLIKVVGVGGGGGNAVENMFQAGVSDVSFLLCNTDRQALQHSEIPSCLVLGESVTKGLGAGNKPEVARQAAEASIDELRSFLDDNHTRMVFVTAGMGGGTGTGAAPVIGRVAREIGLLTVGIVTIPFLFEGRNKILQALNGVEEIRKNVDALLIINNERLRLIYPDLTLENAFRRADETLRNAACGIAEMITTKGNINLDFADVQTTLKDGGIAVISTGAGEGSNRLQNAIDDALASPLLNNNDIFKAKRLLINIYQSGGENALKTEEIGAVNDLMIKMENQYDIIWGYATDPTLGEKVKITILASGFDINVTRNSIDIGEGNKEKPQDAITAREEAVRQRHENDLIGTYYGSDRLQQVVWRPVVLSLDELDNDELIIELERMPTLTRNMHNIDEIRQRRRSEKSPAQSPEISGAATTIGGENPAAKPESGRSTIRFN